MQAFALLQTNIARSAGPSALSEDDDEEESAAFEHRLVQASGLGGFSMADADIDDSEMAKLLKELEVEPKNDEERAAKFQLFEGDSIKFFFFPSTDRHVDLRLNFSGYSETVGAARKATMDFWADAVAEFSGGAKLQVEKEIGDIDKSDAMGIDFEGRRWFVHAMVLLAHKNAENINKLLESIRKKIELLASQDENNECPICLDDRGQPHQRSSQLFSACVPPFIFCSSLGLGAGGLEEEKSEEAMQKNITVRCLFANPCTAMKN